jgi:hypothetical protein
VEETWTRWFVNRNDQGRALIVARIRQDQDGLHSEIWKGSQWTASPRAMNYLLDPLAGDEVDEAGARAAMQTLITGADFGATS